MISEKKLTKTRKCYLGLGANLGAREEALRKALELLAGMLEIELCDISSFYETAPWGVANQPDYLNAAACIRTTYSPEMLLEQLQSVEQALGRVRETHWGARTMDIDILHMEGVRMQTERLTLPHPYWTERAFVLIPLAEIAGNVMIEGKTVREQLSRCQDTGTVVKVQGSPMDFCLKLIACVDQNGGLGRKGKLLFRFSEDMKLFRSTTFGHTVILGRKTFESLPNGRPLEHRKHLVLSGQGSLSGWGMDMDGESAVHIISNPEELWKKLRSEEENFVIGGAEVYRELLPYCMEAFVTVVQAEVEADCFLPDLDAREEFVLCDARMAQDEESGISMEFRHYSKR